jgi:hypothetical protein
MVKIVGTFAVALVVVGVWTLAPGANFSAPSGSPVVAMKSDRLDIDQRTAMKSHRLDIDQRTPVCSQHAWPYYDSACLYDSGRGNNEVRKVRIVIIDRLPSQAQNSD